MEPIDGSSAVDLEPALVTDAGSSTSPPPGSPDGTVLDDLLPPHVGDDDGQDHGEDRGDLGQDDRNSDTGVLTDDLKLKIVKQVEYYLSDENLPTDKYLLTYVKRNKEGFVPISIVASFRKMKKLTRDQAAIVTALKESSLLVLSSDGKRVKRLNPLEARDPKSFIVLVENLPEDHSVENLRKIFGEAGKIKNISIHDPHSPEEGRKKEIFSTRFHALVEYETVEAAEKAAATLNDEQDWRNGLRVKLLSKVGKYGQKKPTWREPDLEKNSGGKPHEHAASEGQGRDTPDEEDVGQGHHKDKIGNKGKTRGRSRRQTYHHSNNGLGHGTTSSSTSSPSHHPGEVSKPPPGPRMPDGTRGFSMGRGRLPPPSGQVLNLP